MISGMLYWYRASLGPVRLMRLSFIPVLAKKVQIEKKLGKSRNLNVKLQK